MIQKIRDYLLTQNGEYLIEFMSYDFKKRSYSRREPRFRVRPMFAWYDLWVGAFWDRNKKQLYVFPLPMIGFQIGYQ